jgi:hypothetical protein
VRIDQDQSGMLAVHLPGRSTHAFHVGFHSVQSDNSLCENVKEKSSTVLPNKELQQLLGLRKSREEYFLTLRKISKKKRRFQGLVTIQLELLLLLPLNRLCQWSMEM